MTTTGIDAYTHDDSGALWAPEVPEDWEDWVSASKTRNFVDDCPLLDWLDLYGTAHGFVRDRDQPGYDPNLDFFEYLFAQGARFEEAVVSHLSTLAVVIRLGGGWERTRSLDACRETFRAMTDGAEIIHQAVLWNPQTRTYGGADLLIRSDVLHRLFPDAISGFEARHGAPGIGATSWHYRVIDIKFTTLKLDKQGAASASDHRPYLAQTFVYNEALGRIQGYGPGTAYLLGRGYEKGKNERGDGCMDRLAPVEVDRDVDDQPLSILTARAVDWIRAVRTGGANWSPVPMPSVPELRLPKDAGSWSKACKQIGAVTHDTLQAWFVGVGAREKLAAAGLTDWRDAAMDPAAAGLNGSRVGTLKAILDINRDDDGPGVLPRIVHAAAHKWRTAGPIEFYVDFETVSSVDDDFTRIPLQNGHTRIFMAGCGHIENGEWKFSCFISDDLSEGAEGRMLDAWYAHMQAVTERLAPGSRPLVFHWSAAEPGFLKSNFKSARSRHPEKQWPDPNWFDFLQEVMRAEPVVIRGAMNFGLKPVAKALHAQGHIQTVWPDGSMDGLGAMVGAWRCAEEAAAQGVSFARLPLMRDIQCYNEIDCKTMREVVAFLRGRAAV